MESVPLPWGRTSHPPGRGLGVAGDCPRGRPSRAKAPSRVSRSAGGVASLEAKAALASRWSRHGTLQPGLGRGFCVSVGQAELVPTATAGRRGSPGPVGRLGVHYDH
jgi:hypothetical protein